MRTGKRLSCFLCALAMLAALFPVPTGAADTVIFTAANEKLYPLSDDTMPFWSGGALYVPHTALVDNTLDIQYNRNRTKMRASLYQLRSGLIFDLSTGYAETQDGESFYAPAIVRGDTVFFPLDVLCPFFGLDYSYMRVSFGYLLRIKNSAVCLSDSEYIEAAASAMESRFEQYSRARASDPKPEPAPPPPQPEPPQREAERTVYFAVESTSAEFSGRVLSAFPAGAVAFLFTPRTLESSGTLLRQLACGAGSVALRIDASGGARETLRRIAESNRALWAEANVKTLLVLLDGADEETTRAVEEAGYCPLRFSLSYGGEGYPSVSRMCANIFSAADERGGSCRVLLGTDEALSGILNSLIANLRTGNCTPARLNEITAQR